MLFYTSWRLIQREMNYRNIPEFVKIFSCKIFIKKMLNLLKILLKKKRLALFSAWESLESWEDENVDNFTKVLDFSDAEAQRCSGKKVAEACIFIKKRLWHRYSPVNFTKFLRTPNTTSFSYRTPPAAASDFCQIHIFFCYLKFTE